MSLLQELFREAARREFAHVPPNEELHYVFSRRFERRMRRLIRAYFHGYWNLINTTAKRVACVAALVILLLTSVMAIRPIRERVLQFFVSVYEDYFEIRFGEEEKDDLDPTPEPMVRYTLTELPEGYEEVEFVESNNILWTNWQNAEGFGIYLEQGPGTQEITLDHKVSDPTRILHNSLDIQFQQYNGGVVFVWEQDNYIFYLTVYEEFPVDYVLNMIDSMTIIY